jgi:ectoine hydroxylase-related dioxygenase (phytanoyl-CoA dioxygenase family)
MQVVRFQNSCAPDEVAAAVREHGYAIVDSVVSNELMDRIAHEMNPYVEACSKGLDSFFGLQTKRTGSMIARSPASRELVTHPLALAVAAKILDKASTFRLNLTQVMTIYPGGDPQQLHRDELAWDFFPFPLDYNIQLNIIWAMTEFTAENGATRIVPGSQKLAADGSAYTEADTIRAVMPRGSALFYTGKVIHGAGANRTSAIRQGINITYAVGWVCQEENQYLATPLEIAKTLPEELLKLMGYQLCCYAMGYVGDWRDPMSVIRDALGLEQTEVFGLEYMKKTAQVQSSAKAFIASVKEREP